MKIITSASFDPNSMFRVRLEIQGLDRQFFDRELIYKESVSKEVVEEICKSFSDRLEELRGLKFDMVGKMTVVSLPHGHQTLTTERNDSEDLKSLKTLFIMTANQLIAS